MLRLESLFVTVLKIEKTELFVAKVEAYLAISNRFGKSLGRPYDRSALDCRD